jgi:hypothetical protein
MQAQVASASSRSPLKPRRRIFVLVAVSVGLPWIALGARALLQHSTHPPIVATTSRTPTAKESRLFRRVGGLRISRVYLAPNMPTGIVFATYRSTAHGACLAIYERVGIVSSCPVAHLANVAELDGGRMQSSSDMARWDSEWVMALAGRGSRFTVQLRDCSAVQLLPSSGAVIYLARHIASGSGAEAYRLRIGLGGSRRVAIVDLSRKLPGRAQTVPLKPTLCT